MGFFNLASAFGIMHSNIQAVTRKQKKLLTMITSADHNSQVQ